MAIIHKCSRFAFLGCALLSMIGCSAKEQVQQGRVIAFDKQNGVVTIIIDSAPNATSPKYDVLPPVKVKVPVDPKDMGAEPEAGKRLMMDLGNNRIVFYDAGSGAIKTIPFKLLSLQDKLEPGDPPVKGKKFPVVDRENKVITIYSAREQKLVTFSVGDEYFTLPEDTWKPGDDIRYTYRTPGQAIRMMNVSKTEIIKW
jgi:uncharacterized protein DUF4881